MCFCIKSAHFQEEQKSYRVWELLNRANVGNVRHFQSVAPLKNHVVNHDHESCPSCTWKVMGVVRKCWRMKKESLRVKFKCWLRSHLHTPAMPSRIQVFLGAATSPFWNVSFFAAASDNHSEVVRGCAGACNNCPRMKNDRSSKYAFFNFLSHEKGPERRALWKWIAP